MSDAPPAFHRADHAHAPVVSVPRQPKLPRRRVRALECRVEGGAVAIPVESVGQIVEYEVAPLPLARGAARVVGRGELKGKSPALLVAHLPRKARRIPPDALDIAGRVDANLPILLACDEALVHPATTLSLGGVTLVEHAATERLYSQIRI